MTEPTRQQALKVLIVHNGYQQHGGEDVVAEAETRLLRAYGHQVTVYRRDNRELETPPAAGADAAPPFGMRGAWSRKLAGGLAALWPRQALHELRRLCDTERPDLIHVHNSFPLISTAPHWLAAQRTIPIVQTLHNFRLLCPQAMLLYQGRICRDCVGKLPWRAVTRACYRNSAVQSGVAAAAQVVQRATMSHIQANLHYIALSRFCRDEFIAGGLPAGRIHIKPNFVEPAGEPTWHGRAHGLYVGRMSEEKGARVLLAAAPLLRTGSLLLAGDGPLASALAQAYPGACQGLCTPEQVRTLLRSSLYLVAPSICLETFGLAAAEAFSCGVPVIASAHGGLGELVEHGTTGLHVPPGDARALAAAMRWAHAHPDAMLRMGKAAYARYLERYTPQRNIRMLEDIYTTALTSPSWRNHEA